jgi:Ca-activated chloride channel family protein
MMLINVDDAYTWLGQQLARGGTALRPALAKVFDQPHDPERHRLVVVLTDGQLADEEGVLQFLAQRLGEARLFIVGIGQKPKQETILRLAEYGRGTAAFARDAATLQAVVAELFAGVSSPVAWDLQLDWGDAQVVAMEPSRLPDLYSGRPVTVFARVRGELPSDLRLDVSTMEGSRTFTTRLPPGGAPEHPGLQVPRRAENKTAAKKPRR